MSELRDSAISIYEAVNNIKEGKYVMPAFQRQFVWSMEKIEKLWDSILQGYPISAFLYWHINEDNVSWDTLFCDFMKDIRFDSFKKSDNINYELRTVDLELTDTAILDGQQRLTSLYITLFGNTGIRQKHQRKSNTTQVLTKLLLELNKEKIDVQDEFNIKKYDIRFTDKVGKIEPTQFEIKNILKEEFKNPETRAEAIERTIKFVPSDSKEYAKNLLDLLCKKVYEEKLIRYTEIFDMNQDDALEMFVRFNSGGVPLRKADITMSILEAYWPSSKTEFGRFLVGDFAGFDTDFIIRTAHMIYGDVVKSNISKQVANDLKNNWTDFRKAFRNTAKILKDNNVYITRFSNSWNVLVPIIFCVYYHPDDFDNYSEGIMAYLVRAILFSFFRSGTTAKLQTMKNNIISYDYELTIEMLDNMNELRVSDAKIEELVNLEKGSRLAGELLYFISKDWIKQGVDAPKYEQDHLHPYDRFSQTQPSGIKITDWVEWKKLANRIPNLHYLVGRPNASKSSMSLLDYYNDMTDDQQKEFYKNSLIPENVSLDIASFNTFYSKRKEILVDKIKGLLK